MTAYRSDTPQIQSPHAWTYTRLHIEDETGACWAAERNGLRDIKPKGLLVRYPNPFEGDAAPEVVYESSTPFDAYWRDANSGAHVLVGKKVHWQEKGKWKAKELVKRRDHALRIDERRGCRRHLDWYE